jgi:hypothetical protein
MALAFVAAACSGGASPVGPSGFAGLPAGGSTTILGRGAGRPSAASTASTKVCVTGTSICTNVNGAGAFQLSGSFSGDVQLDFTGPSGTTSLTVPDVQAGETVIVVVDLSNGSLRVESREAANGTDDVSEDDESEDDPLDDESEDSEDEDGESEDDESEDDESEDDESEDDESEDDESEDDDDESEDDDDESEDDDEVPASSETGSDRRPR